MINIEELLQKFSNHLSSCKSAPFVCTLHAAFESWFRIELIPVLVELQYLPNSIETNYTYPDSRDKADICVRTQQGIIVFELKPFVSGQDANKKREYPSQIKRLENLIGNPNTLQVVTFTTFIGYSETTMKNYVSLFFTNNSWNILGPTKLIDKYQLYVVITSMTKQEKSKT
jgi:hypothetical protein